MAKAIVMTEKIEVIEEEDWKDTTPAFMESNTQAITLEELETRCIVPCFATNELTLSHQEIAKNLYMAAAVVFGAENLGPLEFRVSHPISGRIGTKEALKKSGARVFQALRIDVNSEFEVLYAFMEKLPMALRPGGRVAVLTFHSGEDRIVKKAFQAFQREGVYSDVARDVIRPSKEECYRNSRAHSTKLRWAKK